MLGGMKMGAKNIIIDMTGILPGLVKFSVWQNYFYSEEIFILIRRYLCLFRTELHSSVNPSTIGLFPMQKIKHTFFWHVFFHLNKYCIFFEFKYLQST